MLGLSKQSQASGAVEPVLDPLIFYMGIGGLNTVDIVVVEEADLNEVHNIRIGTTPGSFNPSCVVYDPNTQHAIAAGDGYILAYNIKIPTRVGQVGYIGGPTTPTSMRIKDSVVFIVDDTTNTLRSYDVSDPKNITALDSVSTGTGINQTMTLDDSRDYVYVTGSAQFDNFCVVDISDPNNLSVVSNTTINYGSGVDYNGNYVYIKTASTPEVQIVNLTNASSPSVSSYDITPYGGGYGSLTINRSTDRAYIANQGEPMTVLNISNPTSPSVAATITSIQLDPDWSYEGLIYNDMLYLLDSLTLNAIDISTADSPFVNATYTVPSGPDNNGQAGGAGLNYCVRTPDA